MAIKVIYQVEREFGFIFSLSYPLSSLFGSLGHQIEIDSTKYAFIFFFLWEKKHPNALPGVVAVIGGIAPALLVVLSIQSPNNCTGKLYKPYKAFLLSRY